MGDHEAGLHGYPTHGVMSLVCLERYYKNVCRNEHTKSEQVDLRTPTAALVSEVNRCYSEMLQQLSR